MADPLVVRATMLLCALGEDEKAVRERLMAYGLGVMRHPAHVWLERQLFGNGEALQQLSQGFTQLGEEVSVIRLYRPVGRWVLVPTPPPVKAFLIRMRDHAGPLRNLPPLRDDT